MTNSDCWTIYTNNLAWQDPMQSTTGTSLNIINSGTGVGLSLDQETTAIPQTEEIKNFNWIPPTIIKKSPYTMWNLLKWALTLSAVAAAIGSLI